MEAILQQLLQIVLALITLISSYMMVTTGVTADVATNNNAISSAITNIQQASGSSAGGATITSGGAGVASAPNPPVTVSGRSGSSVSATGSVGATTTITTRTGTQGSASIGGVTTLTTVNPQNNTAFGGGPMQIGVNDTWEIYGGIYSGGINWSPQLIQHLQSVPYSVFRFMNFNGNGAQIPDGGPEETWATRVPAGEVQNPGQGVRISYEAQIALCNAAKVDCWISVPAKTDKDPSFAPNLAKLIKEKLDPSLKVYIEWSNESWNDGGYSAVYAANQARAMGFSSDSVYGLAALYTPCASAQLWSGFESVFTGADRNRLVTVLAGHAVPDNWYNGEMIKQLNNEKCNPNGVMPDAFATAPYFDGSAATAEGMRPGFEKLRETVPQEIALVTYEGGTFESYDYDGYYTYLDVLSDYFDLFMAYNLNQPTYGVSNEDLSDTMRTKAIRDWLAKNDG